MKGEKNKSHHYVPKCYLKNFSSNEKSLWVYNKYKTENNIYIQSTANLCCKDNLYALEGVCSDKLFIEKNYFAKTIEPSFSKMLNHIIEKGSNYLDDKISCEVLTPDEKYKFARLLSIQWFRTPYQQKSINDFNKELRSDMITLFQEGMAMETGNENYKNLKIQPIINQNIEHAQFGYMNEELLDLYAKALADNYWGFHITPKNSVYTSDFPITVKMHKSGIRPTFEGLACIGSELTYPISKNICLTIWDKEYFKDKNSQDSHFIDMSDPDLIHFNINRCAYSNEVYCCENDFYILTSVSKFFEKQLNIPGIDNNK